MEASTRRSRDRRTSRQAQRMLHGTAGELEAQPLGEPDGSPDPGVDLDEAQGAVALPVELRVADALVAGRVADGLGGLERLAAEARVRIDRLGGGRRPPVGGNSRMTR